VNAVAVRPASGEAQPIVASIGEDRTARLWQPTIGRLIRFARLPSPPRALVWTPDGQRLMIGCNDGHVRVVDWETAEIIADKPALHGRIHSLFLDSRLSNILVAGNDQPVAIEL
jgi:WD40 repeat protein